MTENESLQRENIKLRKALMTIDVRCKELRDQPEACRKIVMAITKQALG